MFSEFCLSTPSSAIHPAKARSVYSMVRQEIFKDGTEIATQLDLQDMIYFRTHNLQMAGYAAPIWEKYMETKVMSAWNDDTCVKEVQ